jgi:TolB-like protein
MGDYDDPVPHNWKRRIAHRAFAGIGVLVVALVGLLIWSYYQRATEPVRIAVIPFQPDSVGSGALAVTVTRSLSHRLALIRGFTVLPETVTARYAPSRDSAHAIAKALGVRYLVFGWVEQSSTVSAPDRISIDARLVDTEDSPPTMGVVVTTVRTELCAAIATLSVDIAGHFARAPRGRLWGPRSATGCPAPRLLKERDDASM